MCYRNLVIIIIVEVRKFYGKILSYFILRQFYQHLLLPSSSVVLLYCLLFEIINPSCIAKTMAIYCISQYYTIKSGQILDG